ncbi:hypothetical protein FA95DRAFT_1573061 [Auriscalpium vulgare]|uniref:Uncharacterized protein n=1 Tax=Auriscalpium vulgare TaxID=40419 RepID=A0ACB8RRD5_9AGAM|nr:hypothetical protein FA95DRAFT_1573061 [Auriscalpium vulgare]
MSTDTASARNPNDDVKHTPPIPINVPAARRRSMSVSSTDSSPSSPPALQTPITPYTPGFAPSTSPSSSPLLSYFMSTSPTKQNATFPYRRPSGFGAPPVFEDEELQDPNEPPSTVHARRASTAWAGNPRVAQQQAASPPVASPVAEAQRERGVGVLRRLSLSGGFNRPFLPGLAARTTSPPRPSTPPPSAVTPTAPTMPQAQIAPRADGSPKTRVRRAATLNSRSAEAKHRRAPSPMGERILKGHFDGFN